MASGGDILEIDCKHPTLGQFKFFPISGEDSEFDPGGFRSNDDDAQITGAGTMIDQVNRMRWSMSTVVEWDDQNGSEDVDLRQLMQSSTLGDWTIRRVNNEVYRGTGKPVGDIKPNGNTSTIAMKIAGSGILEKVS